MACQRVKMNVNADKSKGLVIRKDHRANIKKMKVRG